MSALFRQLPGVDTLLQHPDLRQLPPDAVRRASREVLDGLRREIREGLEELPDIPSRVREQVEALSAMRLKRVINATGIVLHTNLGRAPFAPEAAEAVADVARGYSNTEMNLADGKRGGRLDGVREPLRQLTGCEDALAVNNNAGAVMLALTALAKGREVVVSRGELVEIGGSFRVPDIMALSGATLVEVGTTNRTRAEDFARAINENTAALLRVHPSNFRVMGFTERPSTRALAALDAPLIEDLGSGALLPGLGDEPVVGEVLANGADLVCFSGDKLVGGPQAGILAGKKKWVQACRRHPLYRALRLDKLGLAALEATLRVLLTGEIDRIPALKMLREPGDPVKLLLALGDAPVTLEDDVGYSGGGALPMQALPGQVVVVRGPDPAALAAALRAHDPPIIARVADDSLRLDPRTLLPGDEVVVAEALHAALDAAKGG